MSKHPKNKNWGDGTSDENEAADLSPTASASDAPSPPEATIIHYMENNLVVYLNMKGQRSDVSHQQFEAMKTKSEIYLHRDHIWKKHWRFTKK